MILISRKQSFMLMLSLMAIFIAIAIYLSKSSNNSNLQTVEEKQVSIIEDTKNTTTSDQPIVLNSFHRVENKGDKKIWEIYAKKGGLNPITNQAIIDDSEIFFYKTSGDVIRLLAPKAVVNFSGSILNSCELTGDVKAFFNDQYTFTTDKINFFKDKDTTSAMKEESSGFIYTDSKVTIEGKNLSITSKGFTGDLTQNIFKFKNKVTTIFQTK